MDKPNEASGFSHEQLKKSLYFVSDLMSRANVNFFLLDDTAISAKDNKPLRGNRITVGMRKNDAIPGNLSILDAFYMPEKRTNEEIRYKYADVPIVVKIIDSTLPMFTNPDTFMYEYEFFCVPNPLSDYLKLYKSHERKVSTSSIKT